MARIRRRSPLPALFQHLFDRVDARQVSEEQSGLFASWLGNEPNVPEGRWYAASRRRPPVAKANSSKRSSPSPDRAGDRVSGQIPAGLTVPRWTELHWPNPHFFRMPSYGPQNIRNVIYCLHPLMTKNGNLVEPQGAADRLSLKCRSRFGSNDIHLEPGLFH